MLWLIGVGEYLVCVFLFALIWRNLCPHDDEENR
jgi:hypothetical protein